MLLGPELGVLVHESVSVGGALEASSVPQTNTHPHATYTENHRPNYYNVRSKRERGIVACRQVQFAELVCMPSVLHAATPPSSCVLAPASRTTLYTVATAAAHRATHSCSFSHQSIWKQQQAKQGGVWRRQCSLCVCVCVWCTRWATIVSQAA